MSQVDKLGRVKNYAYDSIGSVIHSTRPDATLMSVRSENSQRIETGQGTQASPFMVKIGTDRMSEFVDGRGIAPNLKSINLDLSLKQWMP